MRRLGLVACAALFGCGELLDLDGFVDIHVPPAGGHGGHGGDEGGGGSAGHGGAPLLLDAPLLLGLALDDSEELADCAATEPRGAGYYVAGLDPATGACVAARFVAGTLTAVPALRYAPTAGYFLADGGLDATFERPCANAALDAAVDPDASSQVLVLRVDGPPEGRCAAWAAAVASPDPGLDGRDVDKTMNLVVVTGALGGADATLRGANDVRLPGDTAGGGGLVAAFTEQGTAAWLRSFGSDSPGDIRLDAANAVSFGAFVNGDLGVVAHGVIDTTTLVSECMGDSSAVGGSGAVVRWTASLTGICRAIMFVGEPSGGVAALQAGFGVAHRFDATSCRTDLAGAAAFSAVNFGGLENALPDQVGLGHDGFVTSYADSGTSDCISDSSYAWGVRFGAASSAHAWGNRVLIKGADTFASAFIREPDDTTTLRFARCARDTGCPDAAVTLDPLEQGSDHLVVLSLDEDGFLGWRIVVSSARIVRETARYGPLGAPEVNLAADEDRLYVSFGVDAGGLVLNADLGACPALAPPLAAGRYVSAWEPAGQGGAGRCLWATHVSD
jgi:hypothetical protein